MKSKIDKQIERFKTGFPFADLVRPAVVGDGILSYSQDEIKRLVGQYEATKTDTKILKFVPASGAATRMFKDLFTAIAELKNGNEANDGAKFFFSNLPKFSFYKMLKAQFKGSRTCT